MMRLHFPLSVVTGGSLSSKTASAVMNHSSGLLGQNRGSVAMLAEALATALSASVDAERPEEDPEASVMSRLRE